MIYHHYSFIHTPQTNKYDQMLILTYDLNSIVPIVQQCTFPGNVFHNLYIHVGLCCSNTSLRQYNDKKLNILNGRPAGACWGLHLDQRLNMLDKDA